MLGDGADEADRLRLPANLRPLPPERLPLYRHDWKMQLRTLIGKRSVADRSDSARPGRPLGPTWAAAAGEHGAAMSLPTAAEYALMLTDPGPPRSAPGPGKLSARERELVTLVPQGRTNAQIAVAAAHQRPARSARTWTGSGTRPAAAAAPPQTGRWPTMNETCNRCGPAVGAGYRVDRAGELYLCGQCAKPGTFGSYLLRAGPSGRLACMHSHRRASAAARDDPVQDAA